MLNFNLFPILETDNLVLKKMSYDDASDLFELRSDMFFHEYTDTIPDKNIGDTKNYIKRMLEVTEQKWVIWSIKKKDENKVIGIISIWNINAIRNSGELAYGINKKHQNNGFMSEALSKVIDWAFNDLKLNIIEAYTEVNNTSSIRLLKKFDFKKLGKTQEVGKLTDKIYNMSIYQLDCYSYFKESKNMEVLVKAKRNEIVENYHFGSACIVNEKYNVIYQIGDINTPAYLRSTSKVFQILPLLNLELDKKYGLNTKELAIMMSSHIGSYEHIKVIKDIMGKTNIEEKDFCIKPAYPQDIETYNDLIKNNEPPQAIYHMCSGKHLALMIVEKEFSDNYQNYYLENSTVNQMCKESIAYVSNIDIEEIEIGLDGCGVPVFAITLYQSACAFARMANYKNEEDIQLRNNFEKIANAYHKYPDLIRGKNYFCSYHNYDDNIIGKDGAMGYYAFSLINEKMGCAFKIYSGDMLMFPYVVNHLYSKINYNNSILSPNFTHEFYNDNNQVIGKYISDF